MRRSSSAFLLGKVFARERPGEGAEAGPSPPLIWARRSPILTHHGQFFARSPKFGHHGELLTGIASARSQRV